MHEGQLAIIWLLLSTLALFAMIFGIRYLRNRENMAMIEKGLDPKLNTHRPAPFITLKWGLLLVGAGMGLMAAFFLDQFVFIRNHHDDDANAAIYFAMIAIGGGLGLISSYRIEKKELLDKNS
jgi:TRAP-type C4-dicarboxylate transport system permease small subunit